MLIILLFDTIEDFNRSHSRSEAAAGAILKSILWSTPASFHTGFPIAAYSAETSQATTLPSSGMLRAHERLLNPVNTPARENTEWPLYLYPALLIYSDRAYLSRLRVRVRGQNL